MTDARILLTGGSGRLGQELQTLLPGVIAPARAELDVTEPTSMRAALERYRPEIVVHAAAYTDVSGAERERSDCWRVNVGGTRNVSRALVGSSVLLVHISTDYVFAGDKGGYVEDDPPGPPRNYYALSKLVSEEIVRCVDRHLVVRTSFRPRNWPYDTAFMDVYTSQDYVDVIAPEVALVISRAADLEWDTIHIGTERKSVYDLARRRRPDVRPATKRDAGVDLPDDVSLNTSRWQSTKQKWKQV